MTHIQFSGIVDAQLNYCRSLLVSKGEEYAPETDRLQAFKDAAALQHETPAQALCGMLAKHVVSVYDMCRSEEKFSDEKWTEKITDSINYLLLLKAIVQEDSDGKDERLD